MANSGELPVIDLAEEDAEIIPKLRTAMSGIGFFYIKNHGVSEKLIEELSQLFHEFFKDHARKLYAININ